MHVARLPLGKTHDLHTLSSNKPFCDSTPSSGYVHRARFNLIIADHSQAHSADPPRLASEAEPRHGPVQEGDVVAALMWNEPVCQRVGLHVLVLQRCLLQFVCSYLWVCDANRQAQGLHHAS